MEGVANWAAYRAAIADGMTAETASRLIRRSGKYWSQEEGIAIFDNRFADAEMAKDRVWQRASFHRRLA
ncbi:MAG: hypothetical protein IPG58_06465 [Acidobacteria bacterium]|nr:hypothetical protein [Acidobacteriota bacterium]